MNAVNGTSPSLADRLKSAPADAWNWAWSESESAGEAAGKSAAVVGGITAGSVGGVWLMARVKPFDWTLKHGLAKSVLRSAGTTAIVGGTLAALAKINPQKDPVVSAFTGAGVGILAGALGTTGVAAVAHPPSIAKGNRVATLGAALTGAAMVGALYSAVQFGRSVANGGEA